MTKGVFLKWVNVDGQPHSVTEYSDRKPKERPDAFCIVCGTPVILKLRGVKRRLHYAHKTESDCPASKPETELHYNTKYHIYNQLLSGTKLIIKQMCSDKSVIKCKNFRYYTWAEGWGNRVAVESLIGKFRADIAIVCNGEIRKAIEIKATHAVKEYDDKATFYKEENIDWLEIMASESFYQGEQTWSIDQPLPSNACRTPLSPWKCDSCEKRELNVSQAKPDPLRWTSGYWSPEKEGACELCGERTTDWAVYNGKTGTGKCRKCFH